MNDQATRGSYGQFCPVAMAAEIICSRWTALVLRELLCGTTRFNDIRRGIPLMSPTLLSKRLKELVEAGVVTATPTCQPGVVEYRLTEAGEDLRGIIMSLGVWGQRWIDSSLSLKNLDPSLLMWDMRRNLSTASFPDRKCIVRFTYPELSAARNSFWIVIGGGMVDLCSVDPGFEVDLYVRAALRSIDLGLDGRLDVEGRDRSGQHRTDGRQGPCTFNARLAWPQRIRKRKEPHKELDTFRRSVGDKVTPSRVAAASLICINCRIEE